MVGSRLVYTAEESRHWASNISFARIKFVKFERRFLMRRILIVIGTLVMGALALVYSLTPPIIIHFSEAEMQRMIAQRIPYEVRSSGVDIKVTNVALTLGDDNKAGVVAIFDAAGLTLEGDGRVDVRSDIHYEKGQFFLGDIKKENIQFNWSENSVATLSEFGESLKNLLNRETEEAAQGNNSERKEVLDKVNVYAQAKLEEDAGKALDAFLGRVPVYDLNKNFGMMKLAAFAMDDVVISSEGVTAHLSVQSFILRVASIVLTFLAFAVVWVIQWKPAFVWSTFKKQVLDNEDKIRRIP